MIARRSNHNLSADRLDRRTTAELQAIARGLRDRATAGHFPGQVLAREISRIERLIESRKHERPGVEQA